MKIDEAPLAGQYYVYTGPEGTFQILGFAIRNLFDRDGPELRRVMQTFRFPKSDNAISSPTTTSRTELESAADRRAAATPPDSERSQSEAGKANAREAVTLALKQNSAEQTVRGSTIPYSIPLPADWTVKRSEPSEEHVEFDFLASRGELYFGVIAAEPDLGSTKTAVELVQNAIKRSHSEARFTDPVPVSIGGKTWQAFTSNATVHNIPFQYQYYVYTGPEGTFHLVGWTFANLFKRDAGALRRVMCTFRFPPPSPR